MLKKDPNNIIVCIPAFNESEISKTLDSLSQCDSKGLAIQVFILINGSKKDGEVIRNHNLEFFKEVSVWIAGYKGNIAFELLLDLDLPIKHAGVGLARKILGDKAADAFKTKNLNGVLVYLDADCTVKGNYFQAISSFFIHSKFEAAAIHFEHKIGNNTAILEYELHLRYYILMQRFIGLPYGIHTVGSSMACFSDSYLKKGGMNKRKAGEDFYFLQKFIKDGVCGNVAGTTVFPSARKSERVPFGTGRAMLKYEEIGFEWSTYNPRAFLIIETFIERVDVCFVDDVKLDGLHQGLIVFLMTIKAVENIEIIKSNVASKGAFNKRFFQFFDAFQLMKCLHFLRDKWGIKDIPISEALKWYFETVLKERNKKHLKYGLCKLRKIDNEY
ncbi:MAG: hypothetical protein ACI9IP_002220 [Arcticibacterium sp.]|jgi:hypothetical protein